MQAQIETQETKRSLGEIVSEILRTQSLIYEREGELDEEIERILSLNEKELEEKIDKYCVIIERLECESLYWLEKAKNYEEV